MKRFVSDRAFGQCRIVTSGMQRADRWRGPEPVMKRGGAADAPARPQRGAPGRDAGKSRDPLSRQKRDENLQDVPSPIPL